MDSGRGTLESPRLCVDSFDEVMKFAPYGNFLKVCVFATFQLSEVIGFGTWIFFLILLPSAFSQDSPRYL